MQYEITHQTFKDEEIGGWWELLFSFTTESGLNFKFTVTEPYLISKSDWDEFVVALRSGGDCRLGFYQGNGEGGMYTEGGMLTFVAQPSGAGGDVISETKVPVLPGFADKLEEVVGCGSSFYKKSLSS